MGERTTTGIKGVWDGGRRRRNYRWWPREWDLTRDWKWNQ
jgi:hypothetical protein